MNQTASARIPPKKAPVRGVVIALIFLLLAAGIGAAVYFPGKESPYASGASLISADGLSTTDVQAHVDKLAKKSMMTTAIPNPISVEGTHAFAVSSTHEDGTTSFIPVIQNPAENTRDMKIRLVLPAKDSQSSRDGQDDQSNQDSQSGQGNQGSQDEIIYQTDGLVKPGEGFETIELNKPLKPGTYEAKAIFEGYDPQTHELLGTRIWKITLVAS